MNSRSVAFIHSSLSSLSFTRTIPCYVMLCHVTPCHAMPCHAIITRHVLPLSYHVMCVCVSVCVCVPHDTMSFHVNHAMSCYLSVLTASIISPFLSSLFVFPPSMYNLLNSPLTSLELPFMRLHISLFSTSLPSLLSPLFFLLYPLATCSSFDSFLFHDPIQFNSNLSFNFLFPFHLFCAF